MNRDKLVQVNGKTEKPKDGKVSVQKPDDETEEKWLKKTVQFFSGQPKTIYNVIGKCNTVQLMDSNDCSLEVDTVVSGVEITNCKNVTLKVKPGQEMWTCTVNKTSGLKVELNDVVLNGGNEYMQTKKEVNKKQFNLIGAALSNVVINKKGKDLPLPSKFQFKVDYSKEPVMTNSEFTGNFEKITKGVEMTADGEGFIIKEAQSKGKDVYVSKKQGKSNEMPLNVDGACNSVTLDECKKVVLRVGNVAKGVYVNSCKQVKIIISKGCKAPKVVVNNTHGCYITLESANQEFLIQASHFSDVNMNFPIGAEQEKKELPMREQFVFKLQGDKVVYELPTF